MRRAQWRAVAAVVGARSRLRPLVYGAAGASAAVDAGRCVYRTQAHAASTSEYFWVYLQVVVQLSVRYLEVNPQGLRYTQSGFVLGLASFSSVTQGNSQTEGTRLGLSYLSGPGTKAARPPYPALRLALGAGSAGMPPKKASPLSPLPGVFPSARSEPLLVGMWSVDMAVDPVLGSTKKPVFSAIARQTAVLLAVISKPKARITAH